MEDPKAWKPRKHGIVIGDKDRETHPWEERNPKPCFQAGGSDITMVWSRPWAIKNGMC